MIQCIGKTICGLNFYDKSEVKTQAGREKWVAYQQNREFTKTQSKASYAGFSLEGGGNVDVCKRYVHTCVSWCIW